MKAFILAAGLGTRLKPWTLSHPKALVPVGGVPMLERVITRLKNEGYDNIIVNVHHFSDQIIDFLNNHDFGVKIGISDESDLLLDTGGALLAAGRLLGNDDEPFLVHNVDILSDAPLGHLMAMHKSSGRDITLLTSSRDSSRKLVFDNDGMLKGWHNTSTGEFRPGGFIPSDCFNEHAFSGIYIVNARVLENIRKYSDLLESRKFPIMDYLISNPYGDKIGELYLDELNLIDIGKPDTLKKADSLFSGVQ